MLVQEGRRFVYATHTEERVRNDNSRSKAGGKKRIVRRRASSLLAALYGDCRDDLGEVNPYPHYLFQKKKKEEERKAKTNKLMSLHSQKSRSPASRFKATTNALPPFPSFSSRTKLLRSIGVEVRLLLLEVVDLSVRFKKPCQLFKGGFVVRLVSGLRKLTS